MPDGEGSMANYGSHLIHFSSTVEVCGQPLPFRKEGMGYQIDWKALAVAVMSTSRKDPRWNMRVEKAGSVPPDEFSLRGEVVSIFTERLLQSQRDFGDPPSDLVVDVLEEWKL